jgi:hypothetical protein
MPRDRFFLWASVAMLACVLFAFGPAYYFRAFSGRPDISGSPDLPGYVYLHGAVLTAWFLLPVLQTGLVVAGRTDLHRRVGIAGAILALAVIGTSLLVILRSVPRLKGAVIEPAFTERIITDVIIGDLLSITVLFPLMVGVALLRRSNPEVHRRWMYLSAVVLWGPIIARILGVWQLPIVAVATSPLTWPIALAIHDFRSTRRVHPATIWGSVVGIGGTVLGFQLARTNAAHELLVKLGL